MGNARTSNKDILEAIASTNEAINALVGALSGTKNTAPSGEIDLTPVTDPQPKAENQSYDIPKGYMERMDSKVSELVSNDGQARVLYVRKNLNGETKLAYALKSRWDAGIKDNGLIGAVKVYK